ncbi:immunoglobulin-like and fibronectin type III domain-containing protein 1 [Triplophysa rosa]|uniref:immunoglobulin-like and fibronectin type III domain-containing protein 1 n=1 Tax=Triplophysa rosa TaxID=992332 RepID=UPI0025463611|nr:immunoglobulin-like and fibronectin type III domain-containing protein 1 [Triplophysa rosa]
MWKKSKVSDPTGSGQVSITKRSKVPGVMVTQFVEELPEGKSHPDFIRKPIALTIQEGKLAVFTAIVIGDPTPTVTWARNNGDVSDPEKYQIKYDPVSRGHTMEMPNVSPPQADTYKCLATNEFGKAMVTVLLNVIEVKFVLKAKLAKSTRCSADKTEYGRICDEYEVTDFRWMLKKLNEMKREREMEQAEVIKANDELHVFFELDLKLLHPSIRIFTYKDGEMIPYSQELDLEMKHNLNQVGKKYIFTIKDLLPDDAGLYQLDVEDANVFSTEFKS